MIDASVGRLKIGVFVREWWNWGFRNRDGLHGYKVWRHVGPFLVKWGEHGEPCERCDEVLERAARVQGGAKT